MRNARLWRPTCVESLLRTCAARIDPCFEAIDELGVIKRRQGPLATRLPTPEDERIMADVFEELWQATATGVGGAFELFAELARGEALEDHGGVAGRQVPVGGARWATDDTHVLRVLRAVACGTGQASLFTSA